jgi:hypothetical protein
VEITPVLAIHEYDSRITGSMLLSDDKTSHLAHVILTCVKTSQAARFNGDDVQALREIKRVLATELAEEDTIDRVVRTRLGSYARPLVEGTPEWDVLYRKFRDEEQRRHRKV